MHPGSTRWRTLTMALCLSASSLCLADGPGLSSDRLGTRTAPLLLLTRSDVRSDLRLSAEQAALADQAIQDLYRRAESIRGQGNTPQIVAARRAIDDAQRDWIGVNLSVEQQARLVQIDLQWEGPAALVTRGSLSETLTLSPEQVRSLRTALEERRAEGTSRPDSERRFAEKTLAVLTLEQREQWKVMLGRPFVVQVAQVPKAPAR